jgi:hypothetical protein
VNGKHYQKCTETFMKTILEVILEIAQLAKPEVREAVLRWANNPCERNRGEAWDTAFISWRPDDSPTQVSSGAAIGYATENTAVCRLDLIIQAATSALRYSYIASARANGGNSFDAYVADCRAQEYAEKNWPKVN